MDGKNNEHVDRVMAYDRFLRKRIGKAVRPYRQDGFMNVLNRYGTKKDVSEQYKFVAEAPVPDEVLAINYEGNGLFAKIIDTPAEEAVKHGFELDGVSDEKVEEFYQEALDELDWEEVATTGIRWARLFGGAIAVLLVNDGRGLEEPLDWKNIKSIDDIRVYDRSVITPDYSSMYTFDPNDEPFMTRGSRLGMPEYYHVHSRYGNFTVHESRCLVFQNGVLPEKTTNSIYQIWGIPEYIRIHRALRDAEIAHSSAPKMLDRSVQPIYKMKDLAEQLATEQGETELLKRLEVIDMARGLLNTITVDKDGEDYDFRTFQYSGVADVIDATCNLLSALTSIPQTILFGRSPSGMNATGESDLENYYNYIERIQKRMLKSNLRYLLAIIFQAGLATGEVDEVPKIKVKFKPLWSLSELELAELEAKKAATDLTKAQTAQVYIDMQALDATEVRKKLADSSEFDINTILDEEDVNEDFLDAVEEGVFEIPQQGDFERYSEGVSLEEHNKNPGSEGSAPANAPAATKLPQDMSVEESFRAALKASKNIDGVDEDMMPIIVLDAKSNGWITIKGTHVFTENGEVKYGPSKLKELSDKKKAEKENRKESTYPKTIKGFKHKTQKELKAMSIGKLRNETKKLSMWDHMHGEMAKWNDWEAIGTDALSDWLDLNLNDASKPYLQRHYMQYQKRYEDYIKKNKLDSVDSTIDYPKSENYGSVGVLVIKDGLVLSATRHNDFGYGLVCGPGGHIEDGETPEEAAIRETEEEFGIKPTELIPLGRGPLEHDTGLRPHLFLCTEYEGEPNCMDLEMSGAKFRTAGELDDLAASMFQPFADGLEILKTCIETALFFGDDGGEIGEPRRNDSADETNTLNSENSIDFSRIQDTIKEKGNLDGGPGSGRYPKGSGNSNFSKRACIKALVGVKTSDGRIIKSVHSHAVTRMQERNIYPSSVSSALKNGKPAPGNIEGRTVYQYNGTKVVVVDDIEEIRTVIYKGKGKK